MKALFACGLLLFQAVSGFGEEPLVAPLGEPFVAAQAQLVWAVPADSLPKTLRIYRVVPSRFSPATVAFLLDTAQFTETNRAKPLGGGVFMGQGVRYYRSRDQSKYLGLVPAQGWLLYQDPRAVAAPSERAQGVPTEAQLVGLALQVISHLGIHPSELARQPGGTNLQLTYGKRERTHYDPATHQAVTEVVARQIFLRRQRAGIDFRGPGHAGGVWLGFGNQGRICELEMVWRELEPVKAGAVASPEELLRRLESGQGSLVAGEALAGQKLTVTKVTPYYFEQAGNVPQAMVYPYALIEASAGAGTNPPVRLVCPLLKEE